MLMKIDDVLNHKIGIIGLGVLGSAIAECFINKKIRLIGYDLSDKFYKKLNKSYFSPIDTLEELYSKCDVLLSLVILAKNSSIAFVGALKLTSRISVSYTHLTLPTKRIV